MKKLIIGVVMAALLIAVIIARSRTGSASLTAAAAAEIALGALYSAAQRQSVELPRADRGDAAVMAFLQPGAYVVTRVGVLPQSPAALSVVVIGSWWIWLTAARLSWFVVGRTFGFAPLRDFYLWLLLAPPWRPVYRLWLKFARWVKQFRFGRRATASWTGVLEAMTLVFNPWDSVFIGRLWLHGLKRLQPLGIRGPRHITVVASTGSGKTRWLMAWLGMLTRKASAFIVDCDGQMVNALAAGLQSAGHKVLNFDPFKLTNFPGACWNALDEISAAVKRHGRGASVRFAQTLAEALVPEENERQPIFSITARGFMHGLILYVWLFELPDRRNLIRVRELLTRGMPELVVDPEQDAFDLLLRQMEESVRYDDGCNGAITAVIARAAGVMKSGKGREGNPFRSTAMSASAWLDLPEIGEISKHSDVLTEELNTSNPCVFVCAPVTDIQTKLSGWVRSLTMMSLYASQNMPRRRGAPCAFCIDEMPSLGRIEVLETAAPVFRKFGVRLVVIAQDLERLRQAYPRSYGGFIGNSQATLWMGTDHQETLETLSKTLGVATQIRKVDGGLLSKIPARMERREEPLMRPDQLREFLDPDRKQIIVTRTGKPPIRVSFEGYDRALPVWAYEQDPNYREPFLRALTRRIIRWFRLRKPPQGSTRLLALDTETQT